MNLQVTEDRRTFREFYPNAEQRHQVHYLFAHRFLPQYVQQNPHAFFAHLQRRDASGELPDPTRFLQARWSAIFEPQTGLVPAPASPTALPGEFRRVSDLSMSLHEVGGRSAALVRMPSPEQPPEAHFVCVVLLARPGESAPRPDDVAARVFTLEATFSDPGAPSGLAVVCEWTRAGNHENFGLAGTPDEQAFLQAVESLLASPEVRSVAGCSPPGPDEAGRLFLTGSAPGPLMPQREPGPEPGPSPEKKPWWKLW